MCQRSPAKLQISGPSFFPIQKIHKKVTFQANCRNSSFLKSMDWSRNNSTLGCAANTRRELKTWVMPSFQPLEYHILLSYLNFTAPAVFNRNFDPEIGGDRGVHWRCQAGTLWLNTLTYCHTHLLQYCSAAVLSRIEDISMLAASCAI